MSELPAIPKPSAVASVARRKRRFETPRLRLVPITITMAFLMLGLTLNDLYLTGRSLQLATAQASDKKEEKEDEEEKAKDDEKDADKDAEKEDAKHGDEKDEEKADAKDDGHGDKKDAEEIKEGIEAEKDDLAAAKKTVDAAAETGKPVVKKEYSQVELDVLQSLSARREKLDAREQDLQMKEKLMEATEQRINDKLAELKTLQTQVQTLLDQYGQQENKEIASLVKIYENMKPKDAAAIFNELDMPILVEVIDKMSERKVAPVLAGMDPKKAKDVTQELADKRKLHKVPATVGEQAAKEPNPTAINPAAAPKPE